MKKTIFIFCILLLFSSAKVFSQTIPPTPSICSTTGSTASITVTTDAASPRYAWYYKKTPTSSWVLINATGVYSNYKTAILNITKTATSPIAGTSYKAVINGNLTSNETILTVTTAPKAGTISGTQGVCSNGTTTFTSDGSSGGTWTSSLTAKATINSSTGVITPVSAGTSTITYTVTGSGGCANATATRTVTVTAAPNAGTVSGTQAICSNGTTTFTSNGASGGTWSSSDTAIATINASTGVITPVAAGTSTITYTVTGSGGCANATATRTVTVTAAPNAGTVSGTQAICSNGTTTFTSNGSSGGTWTSSLTAKATINSSTGVITPVAAGTSTITYTVTGSGGCTNATATQTVTVTAPLNAGTVSGTQALCSNGTTTFTSNGASGGTWSSSDTAIATINAATGVITPVAAGTSTMSYAVGLGGCNTTATRTVTVTAAPIAGTIIGTQALCSNDTTTFTSNGTSGGTWTSSDTAKATIASTGVITPLAAGTSTMTYTVTGSGGCTNATATRIVIITAAPNAGTVSGTQTICPTGSTRFTSNGASGGTWTSSVTAIATISGSTGVITPVAAGTSTMTYTVIGSGGCADATTTRILTVTSDLPSKSSTKAITGAGTQPICVESSKTLTSYLTGSLGTIQWQEATDLNGDIGNFNDIIGESASTYTATPSKTTWFRVMNTSGACEPAYSEPVKITINQNPIAGTIYSNPLPSDEGVISVCANSNSTQLDLNNSEGTIQWEKALVRSDGTPSVFVPISLQTIEVYSAVNLTASAFFRAKVSSGACIPVYTTEQIIKVDPVPVPKSISGAVPICAGSDKSLKYALGSVGTIQWQTSNTSATEDDFSDVGEIDPNDTNTLSSYPLSDLLQTTWFRVKNTSGQCGDSYSTAVKVEVSLPPDSPEIIEGGDISVCKTLNSTVLTLSGGVEGLIRTIRWQKASNTTIDEVDTPGVFTDIPSASNDIYTTPSLTATTYYKAFVNNGVCPVNMTEFVKIAVDPTSVSKSITGATPVCIGGSKVLECGIDSVGTTIWQSAINPNTIPTTEEFSDIGESEVPNIYEAIDIFETTWYRVMNTSGVCEPSYSTAVKISVPLPPISGKVIASINSKETELTLNNFLGTTIQWQKATSLDGTYNDIPGAVSSSYKPKVFSANTYFRAMVSNGFCSKVATESINFNSKFKAAAYPNPFETEFNIKLTPLSLEPIEFKVYDILGRVIENKHVKSSDVDLMRIGANYLPGFYSIYIKQGQQEQNLNVIKK